jgi:glycosyltransferase involved in cell wall biosynthesis
VFGLQKEKLIRDSDFLVAPSISPEPFGIVIAESFAHGVPVITSRAGAFPDLVQDGYTGFTAETGSVDGLFSILKSVSKRRVLLKKMSRNCFQEAMKYTIEELISNYLELYK